MAKKQKKSTKKSAKKESKRVVKEVKKTEKPKKNGIIKSILEFISDQPLEKSQILRKLVKRFPDHKEEQMSKTVDAQLPNRMAKERKIKITKDKDGRYFAKS